MLFYATIISIPFPLTVDQSSSLAFIIESSITSEVIHSPYPIKTEQYHWPGAKYLYLLIQVYIQSWISLKLRFIRRNL